MKKPIMYIKTIIQRLINSLRKTIISKFIPHLTEITFTNTEAATEGVL